MRNLQIVMFCCFSVVCVDVLAVLEVTGRVGEDVSIRCSGNWSTENSSEHFDLYFCKGICSRESTIIQTAGETAAVVQTGRFILQAIRGGGAFQVNIMKLKTADSGRYYCGVGKSVIVLYQEVSLQVQNDASTVPPGSAALSATSLQAKANADRAASLSTSAPSPGIRPTARGKANPQAAPKLTETMVVIIISVSLALLVCAIIPLIFFIHWRSSSEAQSKRSNSRAEVSSSPSAVSEPDGEGGLKVALTCSQGVVELQTLNAPESSARGAVYQPLEA